MKNVSRVIMPLIGVILILGGLYLVLKPKIDAYFIHQDNVKKIEQYENSTNH
ncbi:class A sortase SrtA, partial [Staphylococcus felis]